jgi:hypothetical protein
MGMYLCLVCEVFSYGRIQYLMFVTKRLQYNFSVIQDAAGEIAAELQGTPDFIIGNYSDGNLVASLLSYKMGITQVYLIKLFLRFCTCFFTDHVKKIFAVQYCSCSGED